MKRYIAQLVTFEKHGDGALDIGTVKYSHIITLSNRVALDKLQEAVLEGRGWDGLLTLEDCLVYDDRLDN
jgi:hypothetical protein